MGYECGLTPVQLEFAKAMAFANAQFTARSGKAVVKSDTEDIEEGKLFHISVKVAGVARLLLELDASPQDYYLNIGQLYPYAVRRVFLTGTDAATVIVAHEIHP